MRYQVPQFTDIQDKIFGPFTLKQFLIYLGVGLLLIGIFLTARFIVFMIIAVPAVIFAVLFAHVKINGKSLFSVIINAILFITGGQSYSWQRGNKTKPLQVSGPEFTDIDNNLEDNDRASRLSRQAQAIETQGNVVMEDAEDPLISDQNNP
jgi:hypothetical protein